MFNQMDVLRGVELPHAGNVIHSAFQANKKLFLVLGISFTYILTYNLIKYISDLQLYEQNWTQIIHKIKIFTVSTIIIYL